VSDGEQAEAVEMEHLTADPASDDHAAEGRGRTRSKIA
jgi:hypothetical protein